MKKTATLVKRNPLADLKRASHKIEYKNDGFLFFFFLIHYFINNA